MTFNTFYRHRERGALVLFHVCARQHSAAGFSRKSRLVFTNRGNAAKFQKIKNKIHRCKNTHTSRKNTITIAKFEDRLSHREKMKDSVIQVAHKRKIIGCYVKEKANILKNESKMSFACRLDNQCIIFYLH